MEKIDPRLRHLSNPSGYQPSDTDAEECDAEFVLSHSTSELSKFTRSKQPPQKVAVLVSCNRNFNLEDLKKAGMMNVYSLTKGFYTVVSGEVSTSDLHKLDELKFVVQVEASLPMMLEELNIIGSEAIGTNTVQDVDQPVNGQNLPVKGKGVIVGIVDTGIDYTHPSFRHQDGTSRILYLWEQDKEVGILFDDHGKVGYGREYTKEQIDQILQEHTREQIREYTLDQTSRDPKSASGLLPLADKDGHGTHVAGIAAGNGFVTDDEHGYSIKQGSYAGIAPDADLIVVAYKRERPQQEEETPEENSRIRLGNSFNALHALDYILQRAKKQNCPVVINISQGTSAGGHSGETALERSINDAVRQPNIVIVKSAGNEQERSIHVGGTITEEEEVILELEVCHEHNKTYLELWYENSQDQNISVALRSPNHRETNFVRFGEKDQYFSILDGEISIRSYRHPITGGDAQILIVLDGCVSSGTWKLRLQGNPITQGRYDVWIDNTHNRKAHHTQFINKYFADSSDSSCKITIPGTTKGIITVGSYVNLCGSQQIGKISSFSSCGPTRYKLLKPEINAPGEWIISARSTSCSCNKNNDPDQWNTKMCGTSMAAPHVTGAAALILSVCPGLTGEQVKQILMKTALSDEFTSTVPNHTWGSGKLNFQAAVEVASRCAKKFLFPQITNVQINGTAISWETNIPTKGIVRFHSQEEKLRLGKFLEQQEDNELTNNHTVTLSRLSTGETYYCEIEAISEDGWLTIDDNVQQNGFPEFYQVTIPENGD